MAELASGGVAELKAEVDIGIAEADRGEFVEFTADDIIAECSAELNARNGAFKRGR